MGRARDSVTATVLVRDKLGLGRAGKDSWWQREREGGSEGGHEAGHESREIRSTEQGEKEEKQKEKTKQKEKKNRDRDGYARSTGFLFTGSPSWRMVRASVESQGPKSASAACN